MDEEAGPFVEDLWGVWVSHNTWLSAQSEPRPAFHETRRDSQGCLITPEGGASYTEVCSRVSMYVRPRW